MESNSAGRATRNDAVVRYRMTEGIATITLDRPHRLNAVVPELVEELCSALDQAVYDDVGAAVLTGAGRAFSSGHDLREPEAGGSEAAKRARLQRIQDVTRKVRQAPFPVIAAVRGYALGAGCEFALCCDLVVASRDAVFGFPEVEVGLGVTGGISHVLPVTVGPAKARELVLLGVRFDAAEGQRLGLVNRVVEGTELESAARELAETLRDKPQRALALAKTALDRGAQYGIDSAYDIEVMNALALQGGEDARRASREFQLRSQSQLGSDGRA